jgi:bacterioferritin (cytochrome b1)
MDIAGELEKHSAEELSHALIISKQIDYLGSRPAVLPKPLHISEKRKEMLRFDFENEMATIRRYRDRVRPCESLEQVHHGRIHLRKSSKMNKTISARWLPPSEKMSRL